MLNTHCYVAFDRNHVVLAHPSKSGGDWWYGTLLQEGKSGFFPSTYVQKYETCRILFSVDVLLRLTLFCPQLEPKPYTLMPVATPTSCRSKKVTTSASLARSMQIGGRLRRMVLCSWFLPLIWKLLRVSLHILPYALSFTLLSGNRLKYPFFFLSFSTCISSITLGLQYARN